ncbi:MULTISPECIES: hypothetical protein, partial [Pseudomonas]|uniref:hypothetical protein n=1 Tax=Pseudomonas TaxID=286 RepID=UPI001C499D40
MRKNVILSVLFSGSALLLGCQEPQAEIQKHSEANELTEALSGLERRAYGFYPVTADTLEKRHNVPKECSCPNAENTALNSSAKPSRYLAS